MFELKRKRKSAKQLKLSQKSIKKLKSSLDKLLEERKPYRRKGYPRAGAFDRLSIILLEEITQEKLILSLFHPAPSMVHKRSITIDGKLEELISTNTPLPINALLLVGYHPASGAVKYGDSLNLQFAQLEQGIFLQALHSSLSKQRVLNHLQGGLRLENLLVSLPLDMEGITGLVV